MHMQTIAHTPQIIKLRLLTRFVDNIKCRFPGNRNGNKSSVSINPATSEIFENCDTTILPDLPFSLIIQKESLIYCINFAVNTQI